MLLTRIATLPNPTGELFSATGFRHNPGPKESNEIGGKLLKLAGEAFLTASLIVAPYEEFILGGLGTLGMKTEGFLAKETVLLKGSGPQKGILELSDHVKSIKAFDNYNPKKAVDFVFDVDTERMAIATKGTTPKGHNNLANSIKANEETVVGGRLKKGNDGLALFKQVNGVVIMVKIGIQKSGSHLKNFWEKK